MTREYTQKRNEWQIERDILVSILHGADRTMALCHKANLRWESFKVLIAKLEDVEFVVEIGDNETRRFGLTERGRMWIEFMARVESMAPPQ